MDAKQLEREVATSGTLSLAMGQEIDIEFEGHPLSILQYVIEHTGRYELVLRRLP